MNLPRWEGWHLIGTYPDGDPDDVGSWLLHHNGEALLLEVPEGLCVQDVTTAVRHLRVALRYVTASHNHYDHLDLDLWNALSIAFPEARMIHPSYVRGDCHFRIGSEPLCLIGSPKHSMSDVVTVFRGVAMTGDIELGTLDSVSDEVPMRIRRDSMRWLRGFQERTGYHVHTVVSAHLNDVRQGVHWSDLFDVD